MIIVTYRKVRNSPKDETAAYTHEHNNQCTSEYRHDVLCVHTSLHHEPLNNEIVHLDK